MPATTMSYGYLALVLLILVCNKKSCKCWLNNYMLPSRLWILWNLQLKHYEELCRSLIAQFFKLCSPWILFFFFSFNAMNLHSFKAILSVFACIFNLFCICRILFTPNTNAQQETLQWERKNCLLGHLHINLHRAQFHAGLGMQTACLQG